MKSAAWGLAALLTVGISGPGSAQDLKATPKLTETHVGFEPGATYNNYTLTVTGPHGAHAVVSSRSVPSFDLKQLGAVEDGAYSYHLTASSEEKVPLRSKLDDGRDRAADSMLKGVSTSGRFDVKGGAIVKNDPNAREPAARQK